MNGFILIKEHGYRSVFYRIVELSRCQYDTLSHTWYGWNGTDWFLVKQENFYSSFELALENVKLCIGEE